MSGRCLKKISITSETDHANDLGGYTDVIENGDQANTVTIHMRWQHYHNDAVGRVFGHLLRDLPDDLVVFLHRTVAAPVGLVRRA